MNILNVYRVTYWDSLNSKLADKLMIAHNPSEIISSLNKEWYGSKGIEIEIWEENITLPYELPPYSLQEAW